MLLVVVGLGPTVAVLLVVVGLGPTVVVRLLSLARAAPL